MSKRLCSLVLATALLAVPSVAPAQDSGAQTFESSTSGETNSDFQEINALCSQDLKLLGGQNAALKNRLAQLREAAAKLDSGGGEDSGGVGRPVSGEAVSATDFIGNVESYHEASLQLVEAAQRSVALAENEADPVAKQQLYKDAARKITQARSYANRAANVVDTLSSGPGAQQRKGINLGDSDALRQANEILNRGGVTGWQDALEQRRTEDQAPPEDAGTPFFDQEWHLIYDEDGERIILKEGGRIDLTPLYRAVEDAQPGAPRKELFITVPAPSGVGTSVEPTSSLIDALSDPVVRARVREVGGVRLEVTLNALMLAGVNGLEGGGALERVNRPVIISLRRLYEAAQRHVGAWGKLPEHLRYPGAISRVHGFVFSADRSDIILVGAAAKEPRNRIDIDSLILILRAVWAEGLWPQVSLDPMPDRLEGPQYSRIENLPSDSVPARILINADYAMKEIMLGGNVLSGIEFTPMSTRLEGRTTGGFLSRFWLTPKPLSPGTVHVSASGRSVLFETGVDLKTEAMTVSRGEFQGTGRGNEMAEDAARQFAGLYSILQLRQDIQPGGIFIRLQGLVDLASVATIWVRAGIDNELLKGISDLAYRSLEGTEAVPRYFPAVSVTLSDGSGLRVAGGVELAARASSRSLGGFGQRMSRALEQAVDAFADESGMSKEVDLVLTLPEQEDSSPPGLLRAVSEGVRAMGEQNYAGAARAFGRAVELDPFDIRIWIDLAAVEARAGHYTEARNAMEQARRLNPDDPAVSLAAMDVEWLSGPQQFLAQAQLEDIVHLSQQYSTIAHHLILSGDPRTAIDYANWSNELWHDNGDGRMALFWADEDRTGRRARRNLIQAIRSYRRDLRLGTDGAAETLAYALAVSAMQRLSRAQVVMEPGGFQSYEDYSNLQNELSRAIEETMEAGSIDEDLPLAPALEVQARAIRAAIAKAVGEGANLRPVLQQASNVIRRHPDFAFGWYVHSKVNYMLGNLAAALNDASKAIELEPSRENYAYRAAVHAKLGNCTRARSDLIEARRLDPHLVVPQTEAPLRGACD
ncbi:MAG: tetratricopeptide repeat protein [Proteobacteria bacterium]|nr:tetratricopeptide repeat protein [Pseudomonadota bacterium]